MLAKLLDFKICGDERGSLVALENNHNVPFDIKRVYYIFDTKEGVRRGFHAHKKLNQLAVCVRGSCEFLMDNGHISETIKLENNYSGIIIPPMVWHEMFNFSEDCVLMVLASDFYDETDYIRSYNDFLNILSVGK